MNIDQLDLNLLRVFDAVYTDRNVSAVATRLGLSQPTISHGLTRLRLTFKDPLFVRARGGVQPTPRAERLAKPVRDALARLQQALHDLDSFDPATSERTFQLELSDIGQMVFLPRLVEALSVPAPGVRLAAAQLAEAELAAALESAQVDLALGYLPFVGAEVLRAHLFEEAYVLMTRAEHPLAKRKKLSREMLAESGYIMVRLHAQVEKIMAELNLHPRVRVRAPHFLAVPHIVARTDLAVILPERVAACFADTGAFRVMQIPIKSPSFSVDMLWHRRYAADPGNAWLRQQIAGIFAAP